MQIVPLTHDDAVPESAMCEPSLTEVGVAN